MHWLGSEWAGCVDHAPANSILLINFHGLFYFYAIYIDRILLETITRLLPHAWESWAISLAIAFVWKL